MFNENDDYLSANERERERETDEKERERTNNNNNNKSTFNHRPIKRREMTLFQWEFFSQFDKYCLITTGEKCLDEIRCFNDWKV